MNRRGKICESIIDIYNKYAFLAEDDTLGEKEKTYYNALSSDSDDAAITISLRRMSEYLYRRYRKKPSFFWTNMTLPCRKLM